MAEEGIKVRFTGDSSSLEAAAGKASKALSNVKVGSNGALIAMTNLGRVAQDLPFGFIGIANNLNPLTESFQRLVAETGSTKLAFKALANSLVGAGGVGLAVSALSAVMTLSQLGLAGWTRGFTKSREEIDKAKEAIDSIFQKMSEEVSKVELLVNFIQKENISRRERTAAIKELQTIAPAYFAQLNAEKATVDEVSRAYSAFSENIIKSITARIREDQLKKIIEERIRLQDQEIKNWQETAVIAGTVIKARVFDLTTDQQKKSNQERINTLLASEKKLVEEIGQLSPPDLRLEKIKAPTIEKHKLSLADLFKITENIGDQEFLKVREAAERVLDKTLDDVAKKNEGFFAKLFMQTPAREGMKGIADKLIPTAEDLNVKLTERKQQILNAFQQLHIKPPAVDFLSNTGAQVFILEKAFKKLQERADLVGESITKTLGPAFASLFSDILSGSKSAFQVFAQTLGNIIKKLIATAAASLLLSAILGPLGLVKNAAGQTLHGFDAFKSIFGKIGGFAEGGLASGPQSGYPAILHGKEVVTPFDKFMNLIGGGNGQRALIAETVISGNDLRLIVREADKRAGRLF